MYTNVNKYRKEKSNTSKISRNFTFAKTGRGQYGFRNRRVRYKHKFSESRMATVKDCAIQCPPMGSEAWTQCGVFDGCDLVPAKLSIYDIEERIERRSVMDGGKNGAKELKSTGVQTRKFKSMDQATQIEAIEKLENQRLQRKRAREEENKKKQKVMKVTDNKNRLLYEINLERKQEEAAKKPSVIGVEYLTTPVIVIDKREESAGQSTSEAAEYVPTPIEELRVKAAEERKQKYNDIKGVRIVKIDKLAIVKQRKNVLLEEIRVRQMELEKLESEISKLEKPKKEWYEEDIDALIEKMKNDTLFADDMEIDE